jgi:hypothetical protein
MNACHASLRPTTLRSGNDAANTSPPESRGVDPAARQPVVKRLRGGKCQGDHERERESPQSRQRNAHERGGQQVKISIRST